MIKKLRRQFILVTMLSTFAVLAVIIGALNIANYISRECVDLNDLNIISINSDEQALGLSKTKNMSG